MIVELPGGVRAAWSDRNDGDLLPRTGGRPGEWDAAALERFARRAIESTGGVVGGRRLHWLSQVHGVSIVEVASRDGGAGLPRAAASPPIGDASPPIGDASPPIGDASPPIGDASVATAPDAILAVLTADCASVALGSPQGVFAVVHAGWRGLAAGVIESTVARMEALGADGVVGALGPCIHAECYEFGLDDLAVLAGRLGGGVRSRTNHGRPALDVPAAVSAALAAVGVPLVPGRDACTACRPEFFSHRARGDAGRQALVVWPSETAPS